MSKKTGCKMLVHQVSAVLPDDRPITAISVVEDVDKCPPNYTVVSRTYDQDTDADLWRESGLFIKKKGRYICFSKTEGPPGCVVEDIVVINERDTPPEGYNMISYTVDSRQKAWRKKQVCYKIRSKNSCAKAVTDIIICSRIIHKDSKLAPIGFSAAGVINGVRVCYKTVDIINANSDSQSYVNIDLLQSPSPNPSNGSPHRPAPERPPKPKFSPKPPVNGIYPQIGSGVNKDNDEVGDRDYEVLSLNARIRPTRPAPQPPTSALPASIGSTPVYGTLPGSSDLDGVPFALNPRLVTNHPDSASNKLPVIKVWTQRDLDREFFYDFRAERET